jgi:hypothetical protein
MAQAWFTAKFVGVITNIVGYMTNFFGG